MRVLLDTTYARRAPYSGTAIYLDRVQHALAELGGVEVFTACNERRRAPAGGGIGSVRNVLTDVWWTTIELPRLARAHAAQLIHHPLPARAPLAPLPQVVTVLDLAFERLPDHFDRAFRIYAHASHRAAARAASAVLCISETTAADVRALWGVPAARIVVAPLGPGQQLAGTEQGPAQTPAHFLYVGDAEPRKNMAVLLKAYSLYREAISDPLSLVLAGSAGSELPGVEVVGAPTAERLRQLYAGAAALIHPSLYEGFGLTALEAMSVGTPVLAARSPGVVEVCGDAARYADAQDPHDFAAAMIQIAADPGLRRELAQRGRERAAGFSWAQCARRHADAYSVALGA